MANIEEFTVEQFIDLLKNGAWKREEFFEDNVRYIESTLDKYIIAIEFCESLDNDVTLSVFDQWDFEGFKIYDEEGELSRIDVILLIDAHASDEFKC
jgi:hypothetical protein